MQKKFHATVTGTFLSSFEVEANDPVEARKYFAEHMKELINHDKTHLMINTAVVADDAGNLKRDTGVSELKR
jgi:hypothetical protein